MKSARAAAIVTWVYAAAFGLPAVPVSMYLRDNGRLPNLWGMFDMYAGPWSASSSDDRFVRLLLGFLAVTLVVAWSGWLLWRGQRLGAVLNLAVLPVEVVFWNGFALPIPWMIALVRVVTVAGAWRSLSWRRPQAEPVG